MYGNWEQIFAGSRPLSKYISYSGERVNWGLAVVLRSISLYWERLFRCVLNEMIYIQTQKYSWYIFNERCLLRHKGLLYCQITLHPLSSEIKSFNTAINQMSVYFVTINRPIKV